MEYLKVWTSFAELLEPLSDDECGRLFKAMLLYAQSGETMELTGNERFVWPAARQSINNTRERSETAKANGSGHKQTEAKPSKPEQSEAKKSEPEQTEANESKPKQTEAKASGPFDKEKEKDNININIKENPLKGVKEKAASLDRAFDKFWACYPRHTAKQDAKRAFLKVSPDDNLLETMLTAIQRQKRTDQWSDPRYIPHPATWLNGRRWEDEAAAPKQVPVKQVSAQQYTQRDYDEDELEKRLGVNDLFRGVAG